MEPEISVTAAEMSDLDPLAHMFDAYRQFYQAQPDLPGATRFLSERITRNQSRIFIAFRKEAGIKAPAGFTQLYPSFSSVSMKRLWILNDLFVKPEFRRAGVGAALMEAARAFAMEDGAKGLTLATQNHNVNAQALYAKMGYAKDTQFNHFHLYF